MLDAQCRAIVDAMSKLNCVPPLCSACYPKSAAARARECMLPRLAPCRAIVKSMHGATRATRCVCLYVLRTARQQFVRGVGGVGVLMRAATETESCTIRICVRLPFPLRPCIGIAALLPPPSWYMCQHTSSCQASLVGIYR